MIVQALRAAILAVGRIAERVVPVDGRPSIYPPLTNRQGAGYPHGVAMGHPTNRGR